jgi:predicted nucleic acid-binding protein
MAWARCPKVPALSGPKRTVAALERALQRYRSGIADFADSLHVSLCASAGRAPLLTFDERAARLPNVELLPT